MHSSIQIAVRSISIEPALHLINDSMLDECINNPMLHYSVLEEAMVTNFDLLGGFWYAEILLVNSYYNVMFLF